MRDRSQSEHHPHPCPPLEGEGNRKRDPHRAQGALLQRHLHRALASTPIALLCIAYSGGGDSTALLHALASLPEARARGLRALHIDHGLLPDSERWAQQCAEVCSWLDVPFESHRIEVARGGGDGPEAAARVARYAALKSALRDGEWLVTAHHRDDQAETFLLRALRGSGPDGLAAMRPLRRFGQGWLWRPLLSLPRDMLLAYAREHGLRWIEDPSNADTDRDRNFLRHRVLPLLRERWPQAAAALARSAALSAEAVSLLDLEDAKALASMRTADPQVLRAQALHTLPAARRARALRRWIAELALPPLPAEGVARIEAELLPARADAEAEFAWSGAVARRWRDLLHAGHRRAPLRADFEARWDGRAPLQLPTGDALVLEAPAAPTRSDALGFDEPVIVRARRGGERMALPGRGHSHALKHVLQALGVPPWERERLPLLFADDGELLAAGDLAISARLDAWLREHAARLTWKQPL